jgi:hypothetical protein
VTYFGANIRGTARALQEEGDDVAPYEEFDDTRLPHEEAAVSNLLVKCGSEASKKDVVDH